MIVYWSMVLWVPLIYFVYSMGHKEEISLVDYNIKQGIQNKIPIGYAIVMFGYFIFWIGNRTGVADTGAYINIFNDISTNFSVGWNAIDWGAKSPGFDIFNLFFKCFISKDFHLWLMFIAVVSGICVVHTLRKYSINFFLSSYMFITMGTFSWMINGMRQFICVAILFCCCDLIKDGKFFKFFILVLLLSTIHITALLFIPVYFLARSKPWSKATFIFSVIIVIICVFFEPLLNSFGGALENGAYSTVTDQISADTGVNPIRVIFFAIPPVLAYIKREKLESYFKLYSILPICINMSVVASALYIVGMFTSGIFIGRLPVYFDIYNLLLIPFIIYLCFDKSERSIIIPVLSIVMVIYFKFLWNIAYVSDITGYLV